MSIVEHVTKDLTQGTGNHLFGSSKESHLSDENRSRDEHQGESPPGASAVCVSGGKGRNARKIDIEFSQFSSKGVAWRVG